jgi:hypothetical protein
MVHCVFLCMFFSLLSLVPVSGTCEAQDARPRIRNLHFYICFVIGMGGAFRRFMRFWRKLVFHLAYLELLAGFSFYERDCRNLILLLSLCVVQREDGGLLHITENSLRFGLGFMGSVRTRSGYLHWRRNVEQRACHLLWRKRRFRNSR